ncbi:MAG: hypothetical protein JWO15_2122 [Sphingomonadales bacterium]|nr:hypothetical protein [Sphingomonadales bacterium]
MFAGAYLRDNPSLIFGSAWHVQMRDDDAAVLYTITIEGRDAKKVDVTLVSSMDRKIPSPS